MRRSIAKWFWLAFSCACLAYFAVETHKVISDNAIAWSGSHALHALPLAALAYFSAYCVLALAWHLLLRATGVEVAARRSLGIYFTTQVAKYLPGNVGQHVGRLYLCSANGMPALRVGMSMLVEVALVVGAAGLLALPLAPQLLARLQEGRATGVPWFALASALLGCIAITALALRDHPRVQMAMQQLRTAWAHAYTPRGRRFMLGASVLVLSGMMLAGASLAMLAVSSDVAVTASAVATSIAVFGAAWIAGFLAPGAPAGLGIREAILLAGLSPMFGAGRAVEVAILFRLLSVTADLVALCAGALLLRAPDREGVP